MFLAPQKNLEQSPTLKCIGEQLNVKKRLPYKTALLFLKQKRIFQHRKSVLGHILPLKSFAN